MLRSCRWCVPGIALALGVLSVPREARAEDSAAPSSTRDVVVPTILVVSGASLFAGSYGLTVTAAYATGANALYVPVVGPLIGVGQIALEYSNAGGSEAKAVVGVLGGIASVALIGDAAAQAGGLLMLVLGIRKFDASPTSPRAGLTVTPRVGAGSVGLVGSF